TRRRSPNGCGWYGRAAGNVSSVIERFSAVAWARCAHATAGRQCSLGETISAIFRAVGQLSFGSGIVTAMSTVPFFFLDPTVFLNTGIVTVQVLSVVLTLYRLPAA